MGNTIHCARAPWTVCTIYYQLSNFSSSRDLLVANFPQNISHFARSVVVPDFSPGERVEEGRGVVWGGRGGRMISEDGSERGKRGGIEDKRGVQVTKLASRIDT